jgi:hypothetical protein
VHPDFLAWEKSKAKMMIILGAATAIPVSVVTFWFFLYVLRLPSSAGRGLAFIPIGAFLVPGFLFVKLGTRRFRRDWEARGGLPAPSTIPLTPSVEPKYQNEDQGILEVLADLANKLNVSASPVFYVAWRTMVPLPSPSRGFQAVSSDRCVFRNGTVYFAENMKGRLSPEDWRPILASALIYKKLRGKLAEGIIIRLAPIVVIYIVAWFLVPPLFPTITHYSPQGQPKSFSNDGWLILIFVGIAIMFLSIPIGALYAGKLRLIADRRAAELLGGTVSFLDSLNKLREASPSDVRSIETRIENLNRSSN